MLKKNIKIDKEMLRKNKLPLLYNESSWLRLFGDVEDKNIQSAREELTNLVSKEREIVAKSHELNKIKMKSMKMILGVSDSINNENKSENLRLLDEYKNKIENINEELEEIKFQLETLPQEIREANLKLLNATIEYGYRELIIREKVVKESIVEIDQLRNRLKDLIKTKHDYEEWINKTYTFFHGLLGSEIIEKIDKERLR
ncbi:MAG: hypothetical protein M0Q14_03955 [Tissierellaceae bacterium]|nr:hypothetical protein [Tissierellaceae bacterium]